MAYVDPNNNPLILIDEFIRYAKAHLLTVSGQASVLSTYQPPIPPAPSIVRWNGYKIPDIETPKTDTTSGRTNFQSDALINKDIGFKTDDEIDYELEIRGEGIPKNYINVNGEATPNTEGTPQTKFEGNNSEAREAAETYLGRKMTDVEWNALISLTNAESTNNQTERAWVMATILNRTRLKINKATTIIDTIKFPNAYQPVTGTIYKPGPIQAFIDGPNAAAAIAIYGAAVNILKDVPKTYINFTSNNPSPKVYGPGTNVNYLYQLRANPTSKVIGGTIFAE